MWLSENPNAIHLLEKNINKIDWEIICYNSNPNAVHIIERYPEKIDWWSLSCNPNAIHLFEQHPENINWEWLSENPNAIHLLKRYPEKIDWSQLSQNPNIMDVIRDLDYEAMQQAMKPLAEELSRVINNPRNYSSPDVFLQRQIDLGFLEFDDI